MNYSCFYHLFCYPFIIPITNPAERPPAIGIPRNVLSPIWVTLLKNDRIDVKIKFDDSSSLSKLIEIICCCLR